MSEPTELSVERVIALALMHGMRHASGPAQAADVIATALREAGWVMRAEPVTADGHPVHYCAGCVSPEYQDEPEFWCPSCERFTTGRFV